MHKEDVEHTEYEENFAIESSIVRSCSYHLPNDMVLPPISFGRNDSYA